MRGSRRFLILLIMGCCLTCSLITPALGDDGWRTDFDATCAQTETAMSLTVQELVALTEACDRLEKIIAGLEESDRKVFMTRLRLCRNFYLFVLETKRHEPAVQ